LAVHQHHEPYSTAWVSASTFPLGYSLLGSLSLSSTPAITPTEGKGQKIKKISLTTTTTRNQKPS